MQRNQSNNSLVLLLLKNKLASAKQRGIHLISVSTSDLEAALSENKYLRDLIWRVKESWYAEKAGEVGDVALAQEADREGRKL